MVLEEEKKKKSIKDSYIKSSEMSSIIKGVVLVVQLVCNYYRHDVRWLLALFPVCRQQHGGVLTEVRVISGK